jgi:hypothetical protein
MSKTTNGIKYNQLFNSIEFNKRAISVLKKKIPINNIIDINIEIMIDRAARLKASLSFSGKTIASSYFVLATFPKIIEIVVNNERIPISSGVYSLVKTGEIIMGIA